MTVEPARTAHKQQRIQGAVIFLPCVQIAESELVGQRGKGYSESQMSILFAFAGLCVKIDVFFFSPCERLRRKGLRAMHERHWREGPLLGWPEGSPVPMLVPRG